MLGDLDAGMEPLGRITLEYRHAALSQDPSRIDAGVDKMHGAPRFRDSGLQSLTPGLEPPELRQKRRMDIEDESRKGVEQGRFDDAHESGQHHEIDTGLPEQADDFLLRLGGHLGPEWPRVNKACRNAEFRTEGENPRRLHVGEDEGGSCAECAGLPGPGKSPEVRSLARSEDTES